MAGAADAQILEWIAEYANKHNLKNICQGALTALVAIKYSVDSDLVVRIKLSKDIDILQKLLSKPDEYCFNCEKMLDLLNQVTPSNIRGGRGSNGFFFQQCLELKIQTAITIVNDKDNFNNFLKCYWEHGLEKSDPECSAKKKLLNAEVKGLRRFFQDCYSKAKDADYKADAYLAIHKRKNFLSGISNYLKMIKTDFLGLTPLEKISADVNNNVYDPFQRANDADETESDEYNDKENDKENQGKMINMRLSDASDDDQDNDLGDDDGGSDNGTNEESSQRVARGRSKKVSDAAAMKLRTASHNLGKRGGRDPLLGAVAASSAAVAEMDSDSQQNDEEEDESEEDEGISRGRKRRSPVKARSREMITFRSRRKTRSTRPLNEARDDAKVVSFDAGELEDIDDNDEDEDEAPALPAIPVAKKGSKPKLTKLKKGGKATTRTLKVIKNATGARQRHRWTDEEVGMLEEGAKKFGEGRWIYILGCYDFNPSRTSVDLKDKWRNIAKKKRRKTAAR